MKYRIALTLYIVLVQGQVNRNFQLLNEMGRGRTSLAWYFHSPVFRYCLQEGHGNDTISFSYLDLYIYYCSEYLFSRYIIVYL